MLENLIGHEPTKRRLRIALEASQSRNMPLPHMLLSGSPGCGKTTMARSLAKDIGVDFISATPEDLKDHKSVKKLMDMLNFNNYNKQGDRTGAIYPTIIFIDEIHNLPLKGQEILGIAMEEYKLETGRVNQCYWVPYFTLIGATTLQGNLSKPFLNRFKMDFLFQPYSYAESIQIVRHHCSELLKGVAITTRAIECIAKRGRGVPRIIVKYIENIRDWAITERINTITSGAVNYIFDELGIDSAGLSKTEIKMLVTLYNNDAKPIGLENLSILTNESLKTIKETIEPYLIQEGLMLRSGSGRIITLQGRAYLEENNYVGESTGRIMKSDYVRK
jgi:Holliday junction DNA helicase RuvB